jgi:DNA/RNA endonuclease YhcR with UshA esterase domain
MQHSYSSRWQRLALLATLGLFGTAAQAQTPVNFTGAAYSENFDGFTPAGTTYPNGWTGIRLAGSGAANATLTPTVLADNSNSGTVYNAGPNAGATADTDRAIGSLASASTFPAFGAVFSNQSGAAITQLTLGGRAEQWRTSSNATINESLVFEYSLDATSLSTGTWTAVSALDIQELATAATTAGPLNGNDAANSATLTASVALNWPANTTMWVRWKDTDNPGSDALLALDNFTLSTGTAPATPSISFGAASATVAENAGTVQIPVRLSAASTQAITVDVVLATPAGTATSPADFTYTTQTVTFPAGSTAAQNVNVTIVDDATVEASETIILGLQNVTPATAATASGTYTLTITDNDTPPAPTVSTVAALTVNDANGVPTQATQTVSARGTVYGVNQRTAGYQFTLIDNTGGIGLFASAAIGTNVLAEGDSVQVTGTLGQFNGLSQITMTGITPLGRARRTYAPRSVAAALTENEESELITLATAVTLMTPAQWTGAATAYTVDVMTAGGLMYAMRIPANSDFAGKPAPAGAFRLTGLGGQFDQTSPYTEGYQITPRRYADLVFVQGVAEPAFAKSLALYPNPATSQLTLRVAGARGAQVEILNSLGQVVSRTTAATDLTPLNVAALPAGVYGVRLTTQEGSATRRFVKQ